MTAQRLSFSLLRLDAIRLTDTLSWRLVRSQRARTRSWGAVLGLPELSHDQVAMSSIFATLMINVGPRHQTPWVAFARGPRPLGPTSICSPPLRRRHLRHVAVEHLAGDPGEIHAPASAPVGHAARGAVAVGQEQGLGGNLWAALERARQPGRAALRPPWRGPASRRTGSTRRSHPSGHDPPEGGSCVARSARSPVRTLTCRNEKRRSAESQQSTVSEMVLSPIRRGLSENRCVAIPGTFSGIAPAPHLPVEVAVASGTLVEYLPRAADPVPPCHRLPDEFDAMRRPPSLLQTDAEVGW